MSPQRTHTGFFGHINFQPTSPCLLAKMPMPRPAVDHPWNVKWTSPVSKKLMSLVLLVHEWSKGSAVNWFEAPSPGADIYCNFWCLSLQTHSMRAFFLGMNTFWCAHRNILLMHDLPWMQIIVSRNNVQPPLLVKDQSVLRTYDRISSMLV